MAVAEELGVEYEVVLYIKTPPGRDELEKIVAALEDPVEDLVRKDSKFKKLELNPDDYVGKPEAVVDILLKHKQLLQRPVLLQAETSAPLPQRLSVRQPRETASFGTPAQRT